MRFILVLLTRQASSVEPLFLLINVYIWIKAKIQSVHHIKWSRLFWSRTFWLNYTIHMN